MTTREMHILVEVALAGLGIMCLHLLKEPRNEVHVVVRSVISVANDARPVYHEKSAVV
jgi:hypothetical protein